MEGIKTGVLQDSTTAEFVQETYPQTEVVYFEGQEGRIEGVNAVTNGSIDTFVSDAVLLSGTLYQQNLAQENYKLVPEKPLTCDFYGLILPEGDLQWRDAVNAFLRTEQQNTVMTKWLGDYLPQALSDIDYCLNRRKNYE